jgi:ferritin-like metal-binding protein YciE
MANNSLHDLLEDALSRLYVAEQELMRILPRVAEEVSCSELREALLSHVGETAKRIKRLEASAQALSCSPHAGARSGSEGLIRDLMNIAEEPGESGIIDVAVIAALRRIEFCEISRYETGRSIAEALGEKDVSKMLEDNLRDEEAMERFLTVLSDELIDDQSCDGQTARHSVGVCAKQPRW